VTWCTAHWESNHHIARELDAHEKWLAPWVATGRAPRLVAGDRTAKILVTEFLAGELVLGSRAQECLDTFRQAGGSWQNFTLNRDMVTRRTRRTRTPRCCASWLVHEGRISIIDFGRAAMRPALSDWLCLQARDFRYDPARERAFIEGYGADPREPSAWFRERMREAINTAVWGHMVGDQRFEAEGHAMIERVLTEA
jgi:hypothetical protein